MARNFSASALAQIFCTPFLVDFDLIYAAIEKGR
jgi:hypothetical protein